MATRAPSFARRRAMPRPMRLAAPVTSTTLDDRLTVHLHVLGIYALPAGFRQAAGPVRPAPEDRRGRTEQAGDRADRPRVPPLRGDAGQHHRDHHGGPHHRFDGRKNAAAELVRDVREDLIHVQDRAYGHSGARERDEDQRPIEVSHLAEDDVRAAMDDVADRDGALVTSEADSLAQPIGEAAADEEADAGRSPDDADALGAAVEDDLAEDAEQNLRRAAAGGPADTDQADAEDQRHGA